MVNWCELNNMKLNLSNTSILLVGINSYSMIVVINFNMFGILNNHTISLRSKVILAIRIRG